MRINMLLIVFLLLLTNNYVFTDAQVSTLGNTAILMDHPAVFATSPSATVLYDGMGWELTYNNLYDYQTFHLTGLYANFGKWVAGGFVDYSFVKKVIHQWDAGAGFGYAVTPDFSVGVTAELGRDIIQGYSLNGTVDPAFNQAYPRYAVTASLTYLPLEDVALHSGWRMSFDSRVQRQLELAVSYVLPLEIRSVIGTDFRYDFSLDLYEIALGAIAYWDNFSVDIGISGNGLGIGFGFMVEDLKFHVGMADDFDLGRTYTFSIGYGG